MKLSSSLTLTALCAVFASGCALLTPTGAASGHGSPESAESKTPPQWSGSKLYSRDGSVVSADDPTPPQNGSTAAPREFVPSEGGRMYILELYQKAIDERDALELEIRSLQGELERMKQSVAAAERDSTVAKGKVAQLEAENKRLLDENLDLAARLTTAQIRRLQVEKILLESRLEELRAAAPTPETPTAPAPTDKKP